MSWYEQKRQFIDAAARTLWAMAWADHMENNVCGECQNRPDHTYHDSEACEADGIAEDYHEFMGTTFPGAELTDAAPTTPDYARLEAAILLGKLEQANGASLAVIVEAARKADARGR